MTKIVLLTAIGSELELDFCHFVLALTISVQVLVYSYPLIPPRHKT